MNQDTTGTGAGAGDATRLLSLDGLDEISYRLLSTIEGDDFIPPQPVRSYLLRAERRQG